MAENKMREIRIDKVTLNIGSGPDPKNVEKGLKLLETISNMKAVEAKARARIAAWKIRPGLAIGSKVTIRNNTDELLTRLLKAVNMKIAETKFNENGFSFGIPEYIEIPEVKYDPSIGIIGLNVSVTLARPGFRIKNRKLIQRKVGNTHRLTKEDSIQFAKSKLGVIIE
jgi:large subunit ribosomal protein L5